MYDNQSNANEYSLTDPKVIIEVLSPSTQRLDRGDKRLAYQQILSLSDYILVAQDSVHVEHFAGEGASVRKDSESDVLVIGSLQFSIQLSEIYR